MRLATCRERMDEYLKYCSTANTIGVPFRIIDPQEVRNLWPLINLGDGRETAQILVVELTGKAMAAVAGTH